MNEFLKGAQMSFICFLVGAEVDRCCFHRGGKKAFISKWMSHVTVGVYLCGWVVKTNALKLAQHEPNVTDC